MATPRRLKHSLFSWLELQGEWVTNDNLLKTHAINHFKELYVDPSVKKWY